MKPFRLAFLVALGFSAGCDEETNKYGNGIFSFNSTTILEEATPSNLRTSSSLTQTPDEITQVRDRLYLSQADNTIPN